MKAYMSTACSPAAGAVITTYREHLAAKRPEAAEAEACAILAETEPVVDLTSTFSVRFDRMRGWQWDAPGTRSFYTPLDALAESLAAILPELDRLETESHRDAGGTYLGML